jgi:riboflavin kinase/FMN adenylyltransferase
MRLFRDLQHDSLSAGSVVTIGNFDGLHRGHQALVERCHAWDGEGLERAVITFEPLPQAWFNPAAAPGRVTSPRQKLELLQQMGIDLVWMMRFNRALADVPAREFVERVLRDAMRARHVVVGDDFRFGRKREGDLELLESLGREFGFSVEVVAEVVDAQGRISSSAVRQALQQGQFDRAADLLGRPWTLQGHVFRGSQLGRQLGYPTANMKLAARPCPIAGIFAVRARLDDEVSGEWLDGVANLGRRPAVGGGEFLVEVHLFDFNQDLYGRRLEVQFVEKIRNEANFSSLEALTAQMNIDAAQARAIFSARAAEAASPTTD